MNQFLPTRYVEVIQRLALGIEPIDAQRARRLSYALQVRYDAEQFGLPRPPIERHNSNLYALRYQPGIKTPLDLRFFDQRERFYQPQYDRRRVVPRRLSIPVLTLADVEALEAIDRKEFRRRIRRPVFFPGAAYDMSVTTTALRGRVMRGGNPLRWARVVAVLPGGTTVVGQAHGDDRGEFLLLINSSVTTGSSLPDPLNIEVTVFGPASAPVPLPVNLPSLDPLWDLPLEKLSDPGLDDPVAEGKELPLNYTAKVTRVVKFTLGKCLSGEPDFVII